MNISIDIETALYDLLTAAGYSASAHMIPASLGRHLPHVHVARTGGTNESIVLDTNYIDLDVYARTQMDAMQEATALTGWIRELRGESIGDVPCYTSEVTTLPYHNPDPRHPTLGRVTVKARISNRTKEV